MLLSSLVPDMRYLPLLALTLAAATTSGQIFAGQESSSTSAETTQRTRAAAALDAHDYAKALALLTPLAATNPKDAHLVFDLALAQDALDQTSSAETSYRAAITADSNFPDPHVGLGLLLARDSHQAEAHEELKAAVALPSIDPALAARAYRALARLDARPDPGKAADELLSAIRLSSETADDRTLSAELAAHTPGSEATAEATYRKLLLDTPNDPIATLGLAHLLKPAEAEPLLASALKAHPSDPALTAQLASTYAAQDKSALALPLIEQLHTTVPDNPAVSRMLADLYATSGDYAKAEPLLAPLQKRSPHDGPLVDDYADTLMHLHRPAEAETLLQQAIADQTNFPTPAALGQAASHLALAASQNDDPTVALQAIALRDTVLPPSPASVFLAAISHDKLRHRKQAIEAYRQFLVVANGSLPDQEFQARHRLVALEH